MQIQIELPDIKAISRNETNGAYWAYRRCLNEAEKWMTVFGKTHEYHFDKPVDVLIEAYYNAFGRDRVCDAPNIDDKIFTDILVRWKRQKKGSPLERPVWFLEDDSPTYIHSVTKRSLRSDKYKVVITITESKSPVDSTQKR